MPETKPTNPKDAVGIRKAPLSCLSMAVTAEVGRYLSGSTRDAMLFIPFEVLFEIGLGMMEGARKYGRHNYRAVGVRSSVYYDAFCRHMAAYWRGEDTDPDSGLSHIVKAMASLYVLRDADIQRKLNDDRPPRTNAAWLSGFESFGGVDTNNDPADLFNAAFATMLLWWEGRDRLAHMDANPVVVAIAELMQYRQQMLVAGFTDPRPTQGRLLPGWLKPLNDHAGRLIDAKPIAEEPYTLQRPE